MTNFIVKDGYNQEKYRKAIGTGEIGDPLIMGNYIEGVIPDTSDGDLAAIRDAVEDIQSRVALDDKIVTGQTTMTGSEVQLSDNNNLFTEIIIYPHPDNVDYVYIGQTGLSVSTGLCVGAFAPTVLHNVYIGDIYAIGTSADVVTWMGTYK
jgi:hypothetical protein